MNIILVLLIAVLFIGGVLAWIAGLFNRHLPKFISLAALLVGLYVLWIMWQFIATPVNYPWKMEYLRPWIPVIGTNIHLALDGLSYLMVLLTYILGLVGLFSSWNTVKEKPGFYFFNFLFMLAGVTGIFLAIDLFLFYFFWEVMLIPLYFMILIWGGENRHKASFKFLVYTQGTSLIMLIAILGLFFIHGTMLSNYTFEFSELVGTHLSPALAMLLMGGFMVGFFVKFPVIPLHGWLPDTFSSAPVAANVTGLLIKTGAYAMIRFAIPLFPSAATTLAPYMMGLGVFTIIYGAILAFSQTRLYRLIAYSTISHMGFIIVGIFAFTPIAYQGAIIQMIASALSSGALLVIAAIIVQKTGSDDLSALGGLWSKIPVMSSFILFFVLASLGLPGTANFLAEFMTLAGTFKANILMTCLSSLGLVAGAVYALRLAQKTIYGPVAAYREISDASVLSKIIIGVLIVLTVGIGLFPQSIVDRSKFSIEKSLNPSWYTTLFPVIK